MKLEDVKKIRHDDISFRITPDDKIIDLVRKKDLKPVITMHFWKGNADITEARCVIDGYASMDDIASAISCLFINFLYHNKELSKSVLAMVEK